MEYSSWETQAAAALEEELRRSRTSDRLRKLLDEQQTALPEVKSEQRWMAICSEARDGIKDVDAEFRALAASREAEQRPPDFATRSTTIDTTFGPGAPNPYTLQWTNVPGDSTPSDASVAADVNAGTFTQAAAGTEMARLMPMLPSGSGLRPRLLLVDCGFAPMSTGRVLSCLAARSLQRDRLNLCM